MLRKTQIALRNPHLAAMELRRILNHRIRSKSYTRVMNEDWDNLIILDGCRYDVFEETCSMEGQLQPAISPASCTREWLGENFPEEYPDTVYVSANPQTQIHGVEDRFFKSIRIWDECWDEEL